MVQIDLEMTPIIMGFSIGAAFYGLQWMFPPPGSRFDRRAAAKKEEEKEEEKEDEKEAELHQEPSSPESEPGPEPETEVEPPASGAGRARPPLPVLALLALFGLLVVVRVIAAVRAGGIIQSELPSWLIAPTSEVPPEVAAEREVLSSDTGLEAAKEELLQKEVQKEVPSAEEVQKAEQPPAAKPITLNLTRQMMAIQNVGDTIHYKSAYYGTIAVGTPAVEYKVVFDTGSGYLILPSTYCHSETCRAHKRYRRPVSTSARDIDFDGTEVQPGEPRDEMTISFGTGEVRGVLVDEVACIENLSNQSSPPEGCMPISMIIATEMTEEPFKTVEFDGILGLGLMGLSKSKHFSFIHNVAQTMDDPNSRTSNMFSVFLGEHKKENSDITFGGYVEEHMEPDDGIRWNPVLHPELGHWMLEIKSLRIDNEVLSFCESGCRGVVDSGTSLLAVPVPVFPEIHELLRHEADPVHDCKGRGPTLYIELEGLTLTLQPQDYSRSEAGLFKTQPQSRVNPSLGPANESIEVEVDYCKPTLMSMDLPEPLGPKLFVFGEPVLRKYYTIFDFSEDAPQIGFGRAAHSQAETGEDWGDDEDDEL